MRTQKLIIQLPQLEKYQNFEFGRCPRVCCQGQPVLPVGESDIPRTNTLKLFCPKCQDIYFPPLARHSSNLIGKSKTNKKKRAFPFFFFQQILTALISEEHFHICFSKCIQNRYLKRRRQVMFLAYLDSKFTKLQRITRNQKTRKNNQLQRLVSKKANKQ